MIVKKSVAAGVLISIGVYGLLYTNYSLISIILFSFALYTICSRGYYLFTGKCGYAYEDPNITLTTLIVIFSFNVLTCYLIGLIFSVISPEIIPVAAAKVATWELTTNYGWKSFFCGIIMYLAVRIYNDKNSPLGILIGVPLFLLCGFQHCIANATILGASQTWSNVIFYCAFKNFIGAIIMRFLEGI